MAREVPRPIKTEALSTPWQPWVPCHYQGAPQQLSRLDAQLQFAGRKCASTLLDGRSWYAEMLIYSPLVAFISMPLAFISMHIRTLSMDV